VEWPPSGPGRSADHPLTSWQRPPVRSRVSLLHPSEGTTHRRPSASSLESCDPWIEILTEGQSPEDMSGCSKLSGSHSLWP